MKCAGQVHFLNLCGIVADVLCKCGCFLSDTDGVSACKRRFIVDDLRKKSAIFLQVSQSKVCFSLGTISQSFVSKESSLKSANSLSENIWKKASTHAASKSLSVCRIRYCFTISHLCVSNAPLCPMISTTSARWIMRADRGTSSHFCEMARCRPRAHDGIGLHW